MPEPVEKRSGQRYMPGLDGLRAIAVLSVIAYHLEVGFAPGGLLGVGVFFTLSGYLITDILLEGWATRKLSLKNFWLARARRLLPALFTMLAVVLIWVWIGNPDLLGTLRGETISSIFFVENWWAIAQNMSYFDRFGAPSPMSHLWSLAVEEQFYIVWPWLLLLLLKISPAKDHGKRARRERIRPNLALITLGLAFISASLMAVLYTPGFDTTRVYEGTDTRAFALLFGAALAMVWPSRRLDPVLPAKARRNMDLLGVGALAVILLLVWQTSELQPFLYRGGLVILAIATTILVAVLAHPATRLGPIIGCRPLRWIGVRSYAIYLWQLPIIILTTPAGSPGFHPLRAPVQVAAIFLVAALMAVLLGFSPKFGALIQAIPLPVMGGVSIVVFGLIAVAGAKIWVDNKVDFSENRNLIVAAVTLVLGTGDFTLKFGPFALGGIGTATFGAILLYALLSCRKGR